LIDIKKGINMNVLIVEDEKVAADKLEQMLLDIDPAVNVMAKIGSIKNSVKWLMHHYPDLIFLDIQLSDGISFSIFEEVDVNTPVIFTTAYDQYAIRAFQINSIAYLLKPIRKNELEESLRKYKSLNATSGIDFDALLAEIQGKAKEYKKRFLIQIGSKIKKVEVSDIAYFFVKEKSVFLRSFQGKLFPVDSSLDKLELVLDPDVFFRINRKYIVNMNAISEMIAYSRGRVKLILEPKADQEFDAIVSIERSADFKKWLDH